MPCHFLRIALVPACMMLVSATTSCQRNQDAAGAAARAFLDRYFVELNQRAALDLSEGLAKAKIEEEIRRLGSDLPSGQEERSRIYYREVSRDTQDDGVAFRFRLTVMIPDDNPVEPELLLRVRETAGQWRVSNFELLPLVVFTPQP